METSTLFYFSALVLFFATGILAYLSMKRIRMLKQLHQTRLNIASDLHDEIGAALSSISFFSEAGKINLSKGHTDEAAQLFSRIGTTSRETIESMGDIVWVVHPKNDQIDRLFHRLSAFGKEMLTSRNTAFYFYTDPHIAHTVLPVEYRKNLYLICKEAIHNAAKYASAKNVELLIKKNKNKILVVIRDDGTGFDSTRLHEGNGLVNMRVRAARLGSSFILDTHPGRGTVISLEFLYPQNG